MADIPKASRGASSRTGFVRNGAGSRLAPCSPLSPRPAPRATSRSPSSPPTGSRPATSESTPSRRSSSSRSCCCARRRSTGRRRPTIAASRTPWSRLQDALFGKLIEGDFARLQAKNSGEYVSQFANDMVLIREASLRVATNLAKSTLTIIAAVISMAVNDWALTLLLLVVYPLAFWPVVRLGDRIRSVLTARAGTGRRTHFRPRRGLSGRPHRQGVRARGVTSAAAPSRASGSARGST